MGESLESTCSKPDGPTFSERSLHSILSDILEEKLRALELRLEARWRELLRREGKIRSRLQTCDSGDVATESEVSSNFPSILMPPTLIGAADGAEGSNKDSWPCMEAVEEGGGAQQSSTDGRARLREKRRLSLESFGASGDETRREHARSLRSSNASHDKHKQLTPLQALVRSNAVDMSLALVILASSVLVGFEVQHTATDYTTELPESFVAVRISLNMIFSLELFLRVYAFGWGALF
mmetsp:Transcript_42535/g.99167  ORF Transcript_42535/g.99167 Transcript_42535/m.99167 type:complete len:238 (-) Transcript_42535:11-724(-)